VLLIAYQQVAKPMRKSRDLTLALILAVALIDALLLAILRVRLIQGQGCDLGRGHPVVVRPALR
jgi:hypothetical protein